MGGGAKLEEEGGVCRARMSEAGLSFETATRRTGRWGGGREWRVEVMRVWIVVILARRVEARWGEMGIISVGAEGGASSAVGESVIIGMGWEGFQCAAERDLRV